MPAGRPDLVARGVRPADLAGLLADLPPGAWVVLSLTPGRTRWRSLRAAAAAAGLVETRLYWEAPSRRNRKLLVPLEGRAMLRVALARNESSARGRLRYWVARLLVACGLSWILTADVVLVGQRSERP